MPISDDTFLEWVMDAKERIKDKPQAADSINKAAKLAELLKQRRVYREAVIIDGVHGYIAGSMGGPDSNCMALDNALLSADPVKSAAREEMLIEISNTLSEEYQKNGGGNLGDELLVTIGARTYGKKYKVPRVLIAKPYFNAAEEVQKLDVMPLFACQDPPHIKTQLDAMKIAYNSLWRVYLFVHPAFHWNKKEGKNNVYLDLHKKVEKRFLEFTNNETLIKWKNSIDFTQLLPTLPIDYAEFITDETKAKPVIKQVVTEKELLTDQQLRELLDEVFKKVPKDSENVKPLAAKEYELFISTVRKDTQLSRFIENPEKRELLLKNDFVTLHTIRGTYIQNIIQKFKNSMQNDGNGDIFSQQ